MRRTARIAGVLYFLSAVTAGAPLIYVSSVLIAPDSPAITAHNILASEMIFRASIVSELTGAILFVLTVRALYHLLKEVDKNCASLMVTFVLVSVPISFINVLNEIVSLTLLRGTTFLTVIDKPQRDALAMLFLGLHGDGASVANILWGLWLFPFGLLVIRSSFIPRLLGGLLILNGIALILVSLTALLLPAYLNAVNRFAIVPELGELWMMAWLLIAGVKPRPASDCIAPV